MISQSAIQVIEVQPVPAMVLARTLSGSDWPGAVARGISRLRRSIAAARLSTAGPPFLRYRTLDPLEFEVGIPVDRPQSVPGLRTAILPGGLAASVDHVGPIDDLPTVLAELADWVDRSAESAGRPWQWHWTELDHAEARTQIAWPIRR